MTFGYSSVISLTYWRSRARGTQGSVGERTCPLHSLLEPPLPTTLIGNVNAVDTAGHAWSISDIAPAPGVSTRLLEVIDRSHREVPKGDAVVYVDLLPTRSDPAFDRLVEARLGRLATVFHIRPVAEGNLLPEDASAIVAGASHAIRQAASRSETSEVHLLLRCPWTVALLLGRTLNTIRCEPVRVGRWP